MPFCEHQYQRISDEDILGMLRSLHEEIKHFMHYVQGYPEDTQYEVCGLDLIDAILRMDKRRRYFGIFHNMDINDRKKRHYLPIGL
jgi:hypothetical protein